jgi:hypothetical protein
MDEMTKFGSKNRRFELTLRNELIVIALLQTSG